MFENVNVDDLVTRVTPETVGSIRMGDVLLCANVKGMGLTAKVQAAANLKPGDTHIEVELVLALGKCPPPWMTPGIRLVIPVTDLYRF